jgi:hypothetical protein
LRSKAGIDVPFLESIIATGCEEVAKLTTNETGHRIILLNFTAKEAATIAKAGYNVERGFAGSGNDSSGYLPYLTPHPVYEYDILFYNSRIPKEVEKEFSTPRNGLAEAGFSRTMGSFDTPPRVRVSFIGEPSGFRLLMHGGVPFVKLIDADENVAALREVESSPWRIPDLHKTLSNLKTQVSSVGKFFNPEPTRSQSGVFQSSPRGITSWLWATGWSRMPIEKTPATSFCPK